MAQPRAFLFHVCSNGTAAPSGGVNRAVRRISRMLLRVRLRHVRSQRSKDRVTKSTRFVEANPRMYQAFSCRAMTKACAPVEKAQHLWLRCHRQPRSHVPARRRFTRAEPKFGVDSPPHVARHSIDPRLPRHPPHSYTPPHRSSSERRSALSGRPCLLGEAAEAVRREVCCSCRRGLLLARVPPRPCQATNDMAIDRDALPYGRTRVRIARGWDGG